MRIDYLMNMKFLISWWGHERFSSLKSGFGKVIILAGRFSIK